MREQIANHSPIPRRSTAIHTYVSTNRHRARHQSGLHPEDQTYQSTELEDDERYYQVRTPSSAIRYQTTEGNQVIQQGNRRLVIHEGLPPTQKKRSHWLLFLGLGMLLTVLVGLGLIQFSNWWTNHQLDSQYGFPRTYQTDQSVGFNDAQTPTHFIALNLNGQTEVIVCPASNCTKAVIYSAVRLFGSDAASIPVTLSFSDVTHNGKLDMIVHIGDQQVIFMNDGTKFSLQ
jgi:hypothetical protein